MSLSEKPYLNIRIKVLSGREQDGNIQMTVGGGPVDWQTLIIVFSVDEFGICL